MASLRFKQADSESEFHQIHALNHRVFAEEIAQHHTHPSGLLIDRLDTQNTYFIALRDDIVVGMISAHSGPGFSILRRLPQPTILSEFTRPFEARLLAIDRHERNRTILSGLFWQAYDFALQNGGSHLLISAITDREPMYRKLGFLPLGPAVPEGAASFIPMAFDLKTANPKQVHLYQHRWNRSTPKPPISLMPGPVAIHPDVAEAFATPPISHRSPTFTRRYEETRTILRSLIPTMDVTLFPGAGTLANDIVAANLKTIFGDRPGIVLSNGEFGERLANQATRAHLSFRHIRSDWGQPWDFAALSNALDNRPAWLWAVHLETSTGVLNDASTLLALTQAAGCSVALDCVSSLGATPIPTAPHCLFVTGVSGKSLGSYAGLAFVYLRSEATHLLANKTLCPSFDLLQMQHAHGPITTVPSPLLFALSRALERNYATPATIQATFEHNASLGKWLRTQLLAHGLTPIAPCATAAPNIATFPLPSPHFPQTCLNAGYQIAFESPYLHKKDWAQIATMGNITVASLTPLFQALRTNAT